MKEFFKYVLATVVGILAVTAFAGFMSLVMLASIALSGNSKPVVKDGSVLRISLSGQIAERVVDNPFQKLMGNKALQQQGLEDMLKAISVAQTKDEVKGIYLEAGAMAADFAALEELRKALQEFKKQSGKFVVAYGDIYTQGAYYVASVADKIYLNQTGMIDWHGIASQPIFYKDLLDKVGVKMQVFRVGTYKSFVEPYVLTQMSEANRQQTQSFIDDIWGVITRDVAASRKVKADSLNAYADRYTIFTDTKNYVKYRLVDSLTYADGLRDQLRALSGQDQVNFVEPAVLAQLEPSKPSDNEVAVYYAEGGIVDEASRSPLGSGESEIVGSKVVRDLDALANDEAVKAVVLRINSGGGSAFASEQMWRAIQLLKKKKPVVVSMGGMAASGGYYMSCGANQIFAEQTTLTGSIGIFGMVPDASGLLTDKLGLHFDVVKTNQASDFGAMGRPFYPAESAAMQAYVDRGYKLFLQRVAAGRGMKVEEVDRIAQGRVWTGQQALKHKLVDQLGTLDEAIKAAAKLAKVTDYATTTYPGKPSWMDQLMDVTAGDDYLESKLRTTLGVYYEPLRFVSTQSAYPTLQARIFFEPNLK